MIRALGILIIILLFAQDAYAVLCRSNFAKTTITESILDGAGPGNDFDVTSGSSFPNGCDAKVTLYTAACEASGSGATGCADREIMTINRTGNTFTIVSRQDEGTTKPSVWYSGSYIIHGNTAATEDAQDTAIADHSDNHAEGGSDALLLKDGNIDWGANADQVDATDVPFISTSDLISTNVAAAIEEVYAASGGTPTAPDVSFDPTGTSYTSSLNDVDEVLREIDTDFTRVGHSHSASSITSGQLDVGRMPNCTAYQMLVWDAGGSPTCSSSLPGIQVYDVDPIHISHASDGDTAPAVLTTLSAGSSPTKKVKIRDFSVNDDVMFSWYVPYGIDTSVNPTFWVEGWMSNSSVPNATNTLVFTIYCASIATSELLSSTLWSGVTSTLTFDANYVQYDHFVTGTSSGITMTGLAAGETVQCQLKRTSGSVFTADVGVEVIKIKYAKKLLGT